MRDELARTYQSGNAIVLRFVPALRVPLLTAPGAAAELRLGRPQLGWHGERAGRRSASLPSGVSQRHPLLAARVATGQHRGDGVAMAISRVIGLPTVVGSLSR